MFNFHTAARSLVSATLKRACRGIDAELSAKPPRQPVTYSGCKVPINTHERAMKRRMA